MKTVITVLIMALPAMSIQRVEDVLDRMETKQEQKAQGFLIKQKVEPLTQEMIQQTSGMEAKEEEVMTTERREERHESLRGGGGPRNVESEGLFDILSEEASESPSGAYVSHEVFYTKMMYLNEKVIQMENNINKLAMLTERVQDSMISTKGFVLKVIEIIVVALFGGGGLFASIKTFKKKQGAGI